MTHASHFYESGANLYFVILARAEEGREIESYLPFQRQVVDAIRAAGGSLSHHHGVGRLFAPWLADEIGPVGMDLLRGIKATVDPKGILNPGGTLALDDRATRRDA